MSLTKKPEMTPEKIAANQANGRLSDGPATPEGLERIREARTIHGFYSQAEGEALRALGEDPEDFAKSLNDLIAYWQPATGYESRLVKRLARALWRCEREDRWMESVAVHQVHARDVNMAWRIRQAKAKFEERGAPLNRLIEALKKEDFATGSPEIEIFEKLFAPGEKKHCHMHELLYQLLPPGTPDKASPGYEGPAAWPNVPIAEGDQRAAVRSELCEALEAELEVLQKAHQQNLRDFEVLSNDRFHRNTLVAPDHPQAHLMLRSEDSNFRKVERLNAMLTKLKSFAPQTPAPDPATHTQDEGRTHDVDENKGS